VSIVRSVLLPVALAAAVIVPVATFAQQAQQPASTAAPQGQWQGRHHRGGMMRMLRDLNLSDQQKTQIRQIVQQFRQSHAQGERPDALSREQLRTQIMNVLTPEQRAQYQAKMQQMRQER
jgi:Spy/CpxP family protein refolding chaperone